MNFKKKILFSSLTGSAAFALLEEPYFPLQNQEPRRMSSVILFLQIKNWSSIIKIYRLFRDEKEPEAFSMLLLPNLLRNPNKI